LKAVLADKLNDLPGDGFAQAIPKIAMPCGVRLPLDLFFLLSKWGDS